METLKEHISTSVSIIGTGQFGIALADALGKCGHSVYLGSRNPDLKVKEGLDKIVYPATIVSIKECIENSEVVFLAVKWQHIWPILYDNKNASAAKVFVDVSNVQSRKKGDMSTVEKLASEYKDSKFVKTFNNIPALELQYALNTSERKVTIASDDKEASHKIATIAHSLGFNTICYRSLKNARKMESDQHSLFGEWAAPLFLVLIIFILWFTYGTLRHHVVKGKPWSILPMHTCNKILGATGLTVLPLCYLPGSIAKLIQLLTNRQHLNRYPYLVSWLNIRKPLGLITLWITSVHALLSAMHLSPVYFSNWYGPYKFTIPGNHTEDVTIATSFKLKWHGELCILLGIMAFGFMSVIGISAISSVGSKMNRRQWFLLHTCFGHVTVILAAAHVTAKATPTWGDKPFIQTMQGISFVTLQLPYLTILLYLLVIVIAWTKKMLEKRKYTDSPRLSRNGENEAAETEFLQV